MDISEMKKFGAFLEELEELCNRHECVFTHKTHDRILHPKQVINTRIKINYSELEGIEFDCLPRLDF
jgi:hypothetical protein